MFFLQDKSQNALPLLGGWVNTCGVMSAWVQQDDRAFWRGTEGLAHACEVKASGLWVPVWVGSQWQTCCLDDGIVVAPGRVWDVDWAWVMES
jgi:hypothetical protein